MMQNTQTALTNGLISLLWGPTSALGWRGEVVRPFVLAVVFKQEKSIFLTGLCKVSFSPGKVLVKLQVWDPTCWNEVLPKMKNRYFNRKGEKAERILKVALGIHFPLMTRDC
jgi:hypothetical protein